MVLALLLAGCRREAELGRAEGRVPGGARVRVVRLAGPEEAAWRFSAWKGHDGMMLGVRYYADPADRVYGGYELQVRALGNGQFDVLVRSLGTTIEGMRRVPLPEVPAPRVVGAGDAFEIDLARRDGARLFDRVEVR